MQILKLPDLGDDEQSQQEEGDPSPHSGPRQVEGVAVGLHHGHRDHIKGAGAWGEDEIWGGGGRGADATGEEYEGQGGQQRHQDEDPGGGIERLHESKNLAEQTVSITFVQLTAYWRK